MLGAYPTLREREELLLWILHKIYLSANARQCNIAYSVVDANFVLNLSYLFLYCFLAGRGSC